MHKLINLQNLRCTEVNYKLHKGGLEERTNLLINVHLTAQIFFFVMKREELVGEKERTLEGGDQVSSVPY